MDKSKKLKYIISLALLFSWVAIYYIGHSNYLSLFMKRKIVPVIQAQISKDIQIKNIYFNILPLSLEMKGVVISDEGERELLNAERIKIYISILDLLKKKYRFKRILISDAHLDISSQDKYLISLLGIGKRPISNQKSVNSVNIDLIDVVRSSISYHDEASRLSAEGIRFSAVMNLNPEISFRIRDIQYSSQKFKMSKVSLTGRVEIEGETAKIKSLVGSADRSSISLKGEYNWHSNKLLSDIDAKIDVGEISRLAGIDEVRNGKLSVRGKARFINGKVSTDLKLSGEFYLESLMSFLPLEQVPVRGLTSFSGKLFINKNKIDGNAKARIKNGHFFGMDVDSGNVMVKYDGKYLSFVEGKAEAYGGKADVNVALKMPDVSEYSIDITADKIASSPILRLIGLHLPVPEGIVSGSLRTSGDKFNPAGSFIASFEDGDGDVFKRIHSASGEYQTIGNKVKLNNVKIDTRISSTSFEGEYDVHNKNMSFYGTVNTGNIEDIAAPYVTDLKGYGFGSFLIEGTLQSPEVNGMVSLQNSGYGPYIFDKIYSSFVYSGEKVILSDMQMTSENENLRINGSVDIGNALKNKDMLKTTVSLTAKLNNLGLARLIDIFRKTNYPVNGLISGTAELLGTLDALSGKGRLVINNPSVMNYGADTVETIIEFSHDNFRFNNLTVSKGNSVFRIDLAMSMDGSYQIESRDIHIYPYDLPFIENIDQGVIVIELKGQGTLDKPSLMGVVQLKDIETRKVPMGYGESQFKLKDGKIELEGFLFDGKSAFKGKYDMYGEHDWWVDAIFNKGMYDFLPAYVLKDIPEDLLMSIEGGLHVKGHRDRVSGSLLLNLMNISMYGFNFSNEGVIGVSLIDQKIIFDNLRLRSGNTSFGIEGYIVPSKELELRIYGESSLSPLQTMFKSIDSVKGNGEMVILVKGKWDDPVINGSITVSNGSLGIKDFPYRIYDIASYIYIDDNMVVIDSMQGRIGGGDISLRGSASFQKMRIHKLYLDAALKDVTFKFVKGFAVNLDGNVIYRGDGEHYSLVGQVNIIQARYTRRVDWKTQLLKSKIGEKPRGVTNPFLETELNVKISGDKDILVDNNMAKTSLKVDLLLKGTISKPLLFGRVETDSGEVYFRNNEFEIIHASADFIDPEKMNPYFDISAETAVKGYHIRISIEGQFNHFDLSLVSDPPLDETDILSLLTVGEVGGKLEKGIEGGIGAAEATSFLTGEYQDVLEERLTSITGFDRFQIEPYLEEDTGELGPRVTISKRLISDKLFLTYSSSIGSDQEDVVKIEYQVDRNIALVGVRDEKGSIGGDIKFRFEFK
ncbi:MAG: hypothetical protein BV458_09015 [Thermoplasmata archaeon M9B2D]|nr:MAG: hypothetical protein BV458_09015 [Thermoplasmata archaeon M9B2D]